MMREIRLHYGIRCSRDGERCMRTCPHLWPDHHDGWYCDVLQMKMGHTGRSREPAKRLKACQVSEVKR